MIKLNILPVEAKNEIRLKMIFRRLKKFYIVLIVVASAYGLILFGAEMILRDHHLKTTEKASVLSKNLGDNYAQNIKDINSKVDSVAKIQKEYIPLSYLLGEIGSMTNEGIKLQNLTINKESGIVNFTGTALVRDHLLQFKNNLEESQKFEKIEFPISNLTQRENINFNLNARIKSYEFSK